MILENASKENISEIQDIAFKTWYDTYGKILTPKQSKYMLDMMYSESSLIHQMGSEQLFTLICNKESPNIKVGFVSFELNHNKTNTTKIHKLYVLPSMQGKKLGLQLINYVINEATKNNSESIVLNVNRYNKRACYFYSQLGFTILKEENISIGENYFMEDFVLKKTLQNLL